MSDSVPPSEQPETAAVTTPATAPEAGPRKSAALGRLVPGGKRARWVAAGAVAVVVVGGAAAVAVAGHHDHHMRVERGPHMAWAGPGAEGGLRGGPHAAEPRHEREQAGPGRPAGPKAPGEPGRPGADGRGGFAKEAPAPAPIPSLAIGEAAEKAAAAVPGGKVAGLRAVAQEGGGSAWLAVVIGSDGVRHAVTVSGTDGTITSNTTKGQ
ncbi:MULTISPECIES: hypothetical protein [Streptomyces]|uniref:PepSY domain-containing protein n=1 Tax=Streptomyces virginiae TaxID=1961 RepID=A0ABZ1TN16_STRVG|nr:hypothetical protein [Streptomyces virginiae]MCX4960588.1 hypothetical protein [Streptomyces virginiae]WTB26833.1 hypothetical protein OG253_38145 [Streptomyces virginiae]